MTRRSHPWPFLKITNKGGKRGSSFFSKRSARVWRVREANFLRNPSIRGTFWRCTSATEPCANASLRRVEQAVAFQWDVTCSFLRTRSRPLHCVFLSPRVGHPGVTFLDGADTGILLSWN